VPFWGRYTWPHVIRATARHPGKENLLDMVAFYGYQQKTLPKAEPNREDIPASRKPLRQERLPLSERIVPGSAAMPCLGALLFFLGAM
jgi:hypothetical protein